MWPQGRARLPKPTSPLSLTLNNTSQGLFPPCGLDRAEERAERGSAWLDVRLVCLLVFGVVVVFWLESSLVEERGWAVTRKRLGRCVDQWLDQGC